MSQTTIARRFVTICAFLIVVMGSISIFLGYMFSRYIVFQDHEKHAEEHFHHLAQAVTFSLRTMEYDNLQNICKFFYETTPWVVSIYITDPDEKILCYESRKQFQPSIVKVRDVFHGTVPVGKIKLEFTSELVNREMLRVLLIYIGVIILLSSVILGVMAWFIRKTVAIPMDNFAMCMKSIASGDYRLSIPSTPKYREFTLILEEMFNMVREIQNREKLFISVNEDLQREIERREKTLRALEESEAKFRAVMSVAGDGVIIARHDGKIDYSNKTVAAMFGYSDEELHNLTVCDLFSEPDRKILRNYVIVREKVGFSVLEMTGIRKDGSPIPVEVSFASTFEENIPFDLVVFIVRDISWRKEIEREKNEALERMYRLQKFEAIGTLASGIAHDFNNILTIIMGYNELARLAVPEDAPVQEYFSQINSACSRARDLIQQIFTIGRSRPSEVMIFDPRHLVKETIKFLRASIPSSIRIEYRIDRGEVFVKADPAQIQQVLMNLCTNSVHAMEPAGEGLLTIEVEKVSYDRPKNCLFSVLPAGDYVKLSVIDTGCGIPPEILPKIFDPYFTTKEPTKGTGLGLSIVRNIVLSYGGDVEIESETGKGTTMIIYLPFVLKEGIVGENSYEEGAISENGKGKCLLFVDDERSITDLAHLTLSSMGYCVCSFSDPREALNYFRNHPDDINLVITDITMPHIRGDTLARMISSLKPGIPIILCTGYGFQFSPEVLKELGVKEVLYKPFSSKRLAEVIERVLSEEEKS